MARSRPLWAVVGGIYAALAMASIALALTDPAQGVRVEILCGILLVAAAAHLGTRPPAIGTLRNHAHVAATYVASAWAMFAIQPGGSLGLGGAMFVAPFIAMRLVDRREIAFHLVAADVALLAVAASGPLFGSVDATTVISCLLIAAGTTVQCFTCAVMLAAAEQQGAELERLTRSDGLTGVGNRRLFELRLADRVETYGDTGAGFGVVIVDLNDFKSINDGIGHLAGDEVLQIVAARLGSCVRDGETVVRLGGDEFCLLLDASRPGTRDIEARVRKALDSIIYHDLVITAGVGGALWPIDSDDPEVLQLLADARLREDKHRAAAARPRDRRTSHGTHQTGSTDRQP